MIPPIALLVIDIGLGLTGRLLSPYFLTALDLSGLLYLFAAVAFAAIAQEVVIIAGGIDLSVGPLMGFLVVMASFVIPDGSTAIHLAIGLIALLGAAVLVGSLNWSLVVPFKVPPMIATLILYTALQGVSLILRPLPVGTISSGLVGFVEKSVGFVPVAAIVAVVLAIVLDICLVRTSLGNRLRGIGSRADAATRLGVRVRTMTFIAYTGCSVLAAVAALLLMSQVQTGDPNVGIDYTLMSITAVVLGGASIFGGRGSFIGAVLGALLIEELDSVTAIRNLSPAYQELLLGVLTLVAVGAYSSVRSPSDYLLALMRKKGRLRGDGAGGRRAKRDREPAVLGVSQGRPDGN